MREKIWDGDKISLQLVQVPAACTSAAVIAALELLFPDDEGKKNGVVRPIITPQFPWEWFAAQHLNEVNGDAIWRTLGPAWVLNNRLNMFAHLGKMDRLRLLWFRLAIYDLEANLQKTKQFGGEKDIYGKI